MLKQPKIGIIDTGVSNESAKESNLKEIKFYKNSFGQIDFKKFECEDLIGHGTNCFKILNSFVPNSIFYSINIFSNKPVCSEDLMIAGILWCIEENIDIVNISLGIRTEKISRALNDVLWLAYKKNMCIVSAVDNIDNLSFPASHPLVFGVGHLDMENSGYYFYKNCSTQLFLNGTIKSPELEGSSYAAPQITALIAKYLVDGKRSFEEISEYLESNSLGEYCLLEHILEEKQTQNTNACHLLELPYSEHLGSFFKRNFTDQKIFVIPIDTDNFDFLQGINKNLLKSFGIRNTRKSLNRDEIPIDFLLKNYQKYDVFALGKLSILLTLSQKNPISLIIRNLLLNNKSIIVFDKTTKQRIELLKEHLLSESEIIFPQNNWNELPEYQDINNLPSLNKPTILIVGEDKIGVLKTVIELEATLKKDGYSISRFGTNLHEILTDCKNIIPIGSENFIEFNIKRRIEIISTMVKSTNHYENSDINLFDLILNFKNTNSNKTDFIADTATLLNTVDFDGLIWVIDNRESLERFRSNIQWLEYVKKIPFICCVTNGNKSFKKEVSKIIHEKSRKKVVCHSITDTKYHSSLANSITNFFNN